MTNGEDKAVGRKSSRKKSFYPSRKTLNTKASKLGHYLNSSVKAEAAVNSIVSHQDDDA